MSDPGFLVNGKRYPSLSFSPECVQGEPVLFYSTQEGNWVLSTLDLFRDSAQRIYDSEIQVEEAWTELHVILPGRSDLLRCEVGFSGTPEKPLMTLLGEDAVEGALWTCEL